ncbi:uncharacterized protein LOC143446670 isoform X2 [Clavelina lepadiformis]|uniref:uncharacterized protein LOC143446670 isoform X2 n=1 Tax=Clavelina lepadiformis TaxID=159417 RepID=UPI004043506A
MQSVLSEYKASLAELTFNSKPHINMLTVLAEENANFASDIVRIIQTQVFQAAPKKKMPVLYLIDSIVKNFGGQYKKLFSHKLVSTFMCIFQKGDGKTRGDLYKLRSTWDSVFSSTLLKELDLSVKNIDHNWPMRSKKKQRSRNPLSLGLPTSPKFSEEESDAKYGQHKRTSVDHSSHYKSAIRRNSSQSSEYENQRASTEQAVEEVIEEEEIEMDAESLEVLEMLEEKLRKRQAELSRLEFLESKNVTPTFTAPQTKVEAEKSDSDDDTLKIDLNEYPVIPIENGSYSMEQDPVEDAKDQSTENSAYNSLDDDLSDTKHWISSQSNFEPNTDHVKSHSFDGMTTNRVISHFSDAKGEKVEKEPEVKVEPIEAKIETTSPTAEVKSEIPQLITCDQSSQTNIQEKNESSTQVTIETQDESTQYRYRRKTKNFMSQYRPVTKSIGTYFKIKTKDMSTQYEPPVTAQDTAADSTCLPLDDDLSSTQAMNTPKETRRLHSINLLHSLRRQQEAGMLCDITLSAQGQNFKAHKVILASCSEFFHTLFASDALKQSPLSYIELQGITASALNRILEYIYTSEISVDGNVKTVHEIISATKRLKINSLSPVCSVLEEALASDQDLTGWVISNTELLAPNTDPTQEVSSSNPASLEEPQSHFSEDDRPAEEESDTSSGRSLVEVNTNTSPNVPSSSSHKQPIKRSKSDVKSNLKENLKRRKSRSLSLVELPNKKQRKEPDAEPTKPYPCNFCKKSFWKKKTLVAHQEKSHFDNIEADETDPSLTCSIKKVDEPKPNLKRDYKCKECAESFNNTTALNSHIRKLHRDTSRRKRSSRERRETTKVPDLKKNEQELDSTSVEKITTTQNTSTSSKTKEQSPEEEEKSPDAVITLTQDSLFPSKLDQSNALNDDSNVKLKLYQCEVCEEIFSVQCFYKAHMAEHKRNGDTA